MFWVMRGRTALLNWTRCSERAGRQEMALRIRKSQHCLIAGSFCSAVGSRTLPLVDVNGRARLCCGTYLALRSCDLLGVGHRLRYSGSGGIRSPSVPAGRTPAPSGLAALMATRDLGIPVVQAFSSPGVAERRNHASAEPRQRGPGHAATSQAPAEAGHRPPPTVFAAAATKTTRLLASKGPQSTYVRNS
jgi:hypothetical protein